MQLNGVSAIVKATKLFLGLKHVLNLFRYCCNFCVFDMSSTVPQSSSKYKIVNSTGDSSFDSLLLPGSSIDVSPEAWVFNPDCVSVTGPRIRWVGTLFSTIFNRTPFKVNNTLTFKVTESTLTLFTVAKSISFGVTDTYPSTTNIGTSLSSYYYPRLWSDEYVPHLIPAVIESPLGKQVIIKRTVNGFTVKVSQEDERLIIPMAPDKTVYSFLCFNGRVVEITVI